MNDFPDGLWFIDPAHVIDCPDLPPWNPGAVSIRAIQERVCKEHGITLKEMLGPSRRKKYAIPRRIAMALCMDEQRWSYPHVGKQFNRDHTTVLDAHRVLRGDTEYIEKRASYVVRRRCTHRTNMVQSSVG